MKVISPILPKIAWQRPLKNKKLALIDNIHANTFYLVKKS